MFVSFKEITWWVLKKRTIEVSTMNKYMTTSTREECKLTPALIGIIDRIEEEDRVCKYITGFMAVAREASKTEGVEEVCIDGWEEEFIGKKEREFKVSVTLIPNWE